MARFTMQGKLTIAGDRPNKPTFSDKLLDSKCNIRELNLQIKCNEDHFNLQIKSFMNNAKKNSGNYMNEHTDFDAYYNCAIVVSIRTKLTDGTYKYFGYLCCDCLNTQENIEVFDTQSAQLLFALAQQYATYLDTLDSNWINRINGLDELPQGFLQLIYSKTILGKSA